MPNRTLVGVMALTTLVAGARAASADTTNPSIRVRVDNATAVPARIVEEALMIAGGVYRRAGVSVEWLAAADPTLSGSDLTIILIPQAAGAQFAVAHDSMGVVRASDGARATTAYVFLDRVRDFGERGHVDTWIVLGCAIAHELGHLLLPVNSHARDGVMRANWDAKMISRAGGFLSFTPDQARLLRLRVSSRERTDKTAPNRYHD